MRLSNVDRQILAIALPAIITNITTPLLGLMDVAITGHLGRAEYIAAIAVGGNIFNMLYWIFSFLRSGTSGLTSQAFGARNQHGYSCALYRSLFVAFCLSLCILVVKQPVVNLFERWMEISGDTAIFTRQYFNILVWGAPAFLCTYSISGWLIGMQDSKGAMWLSLSINVINILASLSLVCLVGLKIEGVALGTLLAQCSGLLIGAFLVVRRHQLAKVSLHEMIYRQELSRLFKVSRDLFLRTVCLVSVTLWFTRVGSTQGTLTLAANTLLMQFFLFFSYFTDGFAYAGEALCGKYIGEKNSGYLYNTVSRLVTWGLCIAVIFVFLYGVGGNTILRLLSDDLQVISSAEQYIWWIIIMPFAGFAAFIYDGIFIGATKTGYLFMSMVISTAVFFGGYLLVFPRFGNHGLWISFLIYLMARGVYLKIVSRKLI